LFSILPKCNKNLSIGIELGLEDFFFLFGRSSNAGNLQDNNSNDSLYFRTVGT